MISSRVARGAGVLKQGLRHTRGNHSASTYSRRSSTAATMTTATLRSSCAAFVHQNNGYRMHGVRHHLQLTATMPQPLGNPSTLVGACRCFSGRSRGPTDKKRGGAKEGGAKAPYRLNDEGGDESKGNLETDSATFKAQATKKEEGEEGEPTKNSMWMRVKRASSKMKLLWKQYGLVAIGTYTVLYVAGLGGVYLVLATGLVDPDVDTAAWIHKGAEFVGADQNEWVMRIERAVRTNPNAEKVATAFIVNEFLEYPREFLVIAATPSIARALGRAPAKVTKEGK